MRNPLKQKTEEPKNHLNTEEKPQDLEAKLWHIQRRLGYIKSVQFPTKEEFLQTKAQLQKDLDELTQKKLKLDSEHAIKIEEAKFSRTKVLVTNAVQHHMIIVEKDNTRLPIDKETFKVKVPFTNCKHHIEPTLNDLVPFDKGERVWKDIIDGMAISLSLSCKVCRKEKEELRRKHHQWNDLPIGTAKLIIRGLH